MCTSSLWTYHYVGVNFERLKSDSGLRERRHTLDDSVFRSRDRIRGTGRLGAATSQLAGQLSGVRLCVLPHHGEW